MVRPARLLPLLAFTTACTSQVSDIDLLRSGDDPPGPDAEAPDSAAPGAGGAASIGDGGAPGEPDPPTPTSDAGPPAPDAAPGWDAARDDAGAAGDAEPFGGDADLPDADLPDVVLDGPLPTLETALVRDADGVGVEGYPIVVSEADGSSVIAYTDADGNAEFDVPEDGAVTFVRTYTLESDGGSEARHQVTMLLDVPEGQALSFRAGGTVTVGPGGDPRPDPMTVEVLLGAVPAEAVTHRVALLCGEVREIATTSSTFLGYYGCGSLGTFDAYAIALDASGNAVAHARVLDQAYVSASTATLTLDTWATDFIELPYTATPLPTGTTSTLVRWTGYRAGHFAKTARAGLRDELTILGPPSTVARTLRLPAGLFTEFRLSGNAETSPVNPRIVPGYDRFFSTVPPSFSFDVGALALFETFETFETSDPGRFGIRYALTDAGRLGDSMRIGWSWTPTNGETVTFSASGAPHRSRDIPLPELPPEFQHVYQTATDSLGTMSALHDDDHDHDGYLSYLTGSRKGDDRNGDSVSAFRTF